MLNKENKKFLCCHGVLAWAIVMLLVLILITLVFKAGIMVGWSKAGYYHKDYTSQCHYKSKKSIIEQYEAKAEAMGMTVEEFKNYLIEQKKAGYEAFKEEAETKGMTVEEYKEYLTEQKK
jgi:ADP-heptose:LPS heptosyltransferase